MVHTLFKPKSTRVTLILRPFSHHHLTNLALSHLTDKPCGRVTSGIREPQLTSGLQRDMQPQKSSNVKHVGTCRERRYGLHGITIPERGFSSVRRADWPDWQERYGYFPWQPAEPAGILKRGGRSCDGSQERHLLHCKYGSLSSTKANFALSFLFSEMNQCVQGSSPLLYANATICLTRSKISTKVVCVHLSAHPSARVQWEANILKWGQTPKQVECISPAEHWSNRQNYGFVSCLLCFIKKLWPLSEHNKAGK